jgi:hypothetical protein
MSRNVVFYEHIFPFASPHLLYTPLENHLMTSLKEWVEIVADPNTSSPPFNGPQEHVISPIAPLDSPTDATLTILPFSPSDQGLQSPNLPSPPTFHGPQEPVISPIAPLDSPIDATPMILPFSPSDQGLQSPNSTSPPTFHGP